MDDETNLSQLPSQRQIHQKMDQKQNACHIQKVANSYYLPKTYYDPKGQPGWPTASEHH